MMFLSVVLVLLLLQLGVRSHPCDLRRSEEYGGLLADCSGRGLTSVPSDLPSHIVALDLSSNKISRIQNFTFKSFKNLVFLNVLGNLLRELEPMTFNGLSKLQILNLHDNFLRSDKASLPEGIFNSLESLQTLWLEAQSFDEYPDWIFPPLVNLKTLYIDSVQIPNFGKGFSNLMRLEFLQIDGHGYESQTRCQIRIFENNTFEAFRNISLKTLKVTKCRSASRIESGVFEPLKSLHTLIFSGIDIGIHLSLQLLYPFSGRSMQLLDLSSIFPKHRLLIPNASDTFLREKDTEYLSKICVREFLFSNNHIVYIAVSALHGKPFSDCLQTLDLSKNTLIGDIRIFFKLQNFSKLKKLLFGDMSFIQQTNGNLLGDHLKKIIVRLPETLEVLDISGLLRKDSLLDLGGISVLELRNTTNLKTFRTSNNELTEQLKFKGIEHIEELDLSDNFIGDISNIGFQHFKKVKILSLKDCNLRLANSEGSNLTNFPNVQVIDVSKNLLSKFPILTNPQSVKELILNENSFDSIAIDLELFQMLTKIDLTFNSISFLSKSVRYKIDNANTHQGLKLHLRGNTFSCGCKELDFVQWFVETPAVYETDRRFSCILDNGTTTDIMKVSNNIQYHIRHCRGPTIFTLTITFGLLLIIALSGTYVIMKNPTRYQHLLLRFIGLQRKVFTRDEFPFMLYVAYTSSDIPLVYRQLRPALERQNIPLFLKDREVLPGYDIADGVSDGINSSWKTLLVVSVDFLNDPWSTFIINSSLYSMTEMIPNRIIILLVDGVQLEDVPDTLLRAVDEDFVLEYYAANDHSQWDELIQLLN